MTEPVKDVDGVEFDPAIHAIKKDGSPKKTPSGNWAKLYKPAVAETPVKPQEEPDEVQPVIEPVEPKPEPAPIAPPTPNQRVLMVNRRSGARLWVWPADMTTYVEQGYSLA